METLLILSCVPIILAIPFGIKESIAVKKVRIEKTAKFSINNPHVKDVTWFVLGMCILWEMQRKTSNKHCML